MAFEQMVLRSLLHYTWGSVICFWHAIFILSLNVKLFLERSFTLSDKIRISTVVSKCFQKIKILPLLKISLLFRCSDCWVDLRYPHPREAWGSRAPIYKHNSGNNSITVGIWILGYSGDSNIEHVWFRMVNSCSVQSRPFENRT